MAVSSHSEEGNHAHWVDFMEEIMIRVISQWQGWWIPFIPINNIKCGNPDNSTNGINYDAIPCWNLFSLFTILVLFIMPNRYVQSTRFPLSFTVLSILCILRPTFPSPFFFWGKKNLARVYRERKSLEKTLAFEDGEKAPAKDYIEITRGLHALVCTHAHSHAANTPLRNIHGVTHPNKDKHNTNTRI